MGLGWGKHIIHGQKRNINISDPNNLIILVKKVIPLHLQQTQTVPSQLPIDLPKCLDEVTLGTKLEALIELDDSLFDKGQELRINAMRVIERHKCN